MMPDVRTVQQAAAAAVAATAATKAVDVHALRHTVTCALNNVSAFVSDSGQSLQLLRLQPCRHSSSPG